MKLIISVILTMSPLFSKAGSQDKMRIVCQSPFRGSSYVGTVREEIRVPRLVVLDQAAESDVSYNTILSNVNVLIGELEDVPFDIYANSRMHDVDILEMSSEQVLAVSEDIIHAESGNPFSFERLSGKMTVEAYKSGASLKTEMNIGQADQQFNLTIGFGSGKVEIAVGKYTGTPPSNHKFRGDVTFYRCKGPFRIQPKQEGSYEDAYSGGQGDESRY